MNEYYSDEYPESEEYSYMSKSEENYQKNKDMQKICMQKLPAPISITSVPIEKDAQIPESVITEEIFVPIGKSSRDPLPSKGVMTANRNKITAQTGTPHTRIPTGIRFTEERHRSRTISIFNEQKPEK
ncbi:unnamed protein product [Brugia pahangi]|uniref:Uncharacterized protein n=1 Tax=Brugia pahangi TaxID=6280 RepID=A0A0N4TPH4_BRUPA|nr:unnamed protein product [Brugia pahangi]